MSWPVCKIAVALYPLAAGAMAVNVFFASLLASWIGFSVLTTSQSILLGSVIALPAVWAFARHISRLMEVADQ